MSHLTSDVTRRIDPSDEDICPCHSSAYMENRAERVSVDEDESLIYLD